MRRPKWKSQREPHSTDTLKSAQAEFRRRGWHRRATGVILAQFAVVLAKTISGLAVFVFSPSYPVKALGMFLSVDGGTPHVEELAQAVAAS
jgi:hypothetical protein